MSAYRSLTTGMATGRSHQFQEMMRGRRFVKFSRRFEDSSIHGYVQGIGPKFFILARVSDRIRFDGFQCLRMSDVRDLELDPYAQFAKAALRKRGERVPRKPRVNLARIEDLLLSANRLFPLVTIHREQVDADVCWIGRVTGITRGRVALLEIGPDAIWDERPTQYRLGEITRVDFGGDYENALHLVGGEPPASPAKGGS